MLLLHSQVPAENAVSVVVDVAAYAEVCLASRCLETCSITPLFHCCSARATYEENSLIYCCMLVSVCRAVAWQRFDQICCNILIVVYVINLRKNKRSSTTQLNTIRNPRAIFIRLR
jgi:hypothetical protein